MTAGPHVGKKVSEAKPIIRDEMLAAGQATPYSEPEHKVRRLRTSVAFAAGDRKRCQAKDRLLLCTPMLQVMSRSGDECVVALTDQWYLAYGEDAWRDATLRALEGMETYSEDCRHAFK